MLLMFNVPEKSILMLLCLSQPSFNEAYALCPCLHVELISPMEICICWGEVNSRQQCMLHDQTARVQISHGLHDGYHCM